jgi:hypothetical protein
MANRRLLLAVLGALGIFTFLFVTLRHRPSPQAKFVPDDRLEEVVRIAKSKAGSAAVSAAGLKSQEDESYSNVPIHHIEVGADTLKGGVIMPKLDNATLK